MNILSICDNPDVLQVMRIINIVITIIKIAVPILLIIFIPIIAQIGINSAYSTNSRIDNDLKITGKDVARKILDKNGLQNVEIVCINYFF